MIQFFFLCVAVAERGVFFKTFPEATSSDRKPQPPVTNGSTTLPAPINITPVRKYYCPVCGEGFGSKGVLNDHFESHSLGGLSSSGRALDTTQTKEQFEAINTIGEIGTVRNPVPGTEQHTGSTLRLSTSENTLLNTAELNELYSADINAVLGASDHRNTEVKLGGTDVTAAVVIQPSIEENVVPLTICQNGAGVNPVSGTTSQTSTKSPVKMSSRQSSKETKVIAKKQNEGKRVNTKKGFVCKICGEPRTSLQALSGHFDIKHSDLKFYSCMLCNSSFVELLQLKNHLKEAHECNLCSGCGKEVKVCDMNNHLKKCEFSMLKDIMGAFQEVYHHQSSKEKVAAKSQEKVNEKASSAKSFRCKVCGKMFKSQRKQKIHTAFYHTSMPYECHLCKQRFGKKQSLLQHQKREHKDQEHVKPECRTCRKTFETQRNLMIHMSVFHASHKLYRCKVCQKTFRRPWQLKDHAKSHVDSRRFECELCGMVFDTSTKLEAHTLVAHIRPGLHTCSICNLQLNSNWSLADHMNNHNAAQNPSQNNLSSDAHANDNMFPYSDSILPTSLPIANEVIKTEPVDFSYGDLNPTDFPSQDNQASSFNLRISEAFSLNQPEPQQDFIPTVILPNSEKYVRPQMYVKKMTVRDMLAKDRAERGKGFKFTCQQPQCGKAFATYKDLSKHKEKFHPRKDVWACDKCPKTFRMQHHLQQHSLVHKVPNTCSKCGGKYKYWNSHFRICPRGKDYTGHKEAGEVSKEKKSTKDLVSEDARIDLNLEVTSDVVESQGQHDTPTKQSSKLKLSGNMFKFKLPKDQWKCKVCEKIFGTRRSMKQHLEIHKYEKVKYCPSCGKMFKMQETFDRHVLVCKTQGQYACTVCATLFRSRSLWLEHRLVHNIHNKEPDATSSHPKYVHRPTHVCCGFFYPNVVALYMHQKETHGNTFVNIQCRLCKVRFSRLDRFVSHVESYSSDEQFSCPCCDNRFHEFSQLSKHMARHPNEQMACRLCENSLLTWDLPMHRKNLHGPDVWNEEENAQEEEALLNVSEGNVSLMSPTTSVSPGASADHLVQIAAGRPRRSEIQRHFQCTICGQHFGSYYFFKKHSLTEHKDQIDGDVMQSVEKKKLCIVLTPLKSITCGKCDKSFKSDYLLGKHKESGECADQLSQMPVQSYFGEQSDINTSVTQHNSSMKGAGHKLMTVDGPTKFWCEICMVYFRNPYFMNKHMVLHENNIELKATENWERRQEIEKIVRELTYKEPKVPERRRSEKSLPVATATKFKCPTCQEYYRSAYFLKVHIKEVHGDYKQDESNKGDEGETVQGSPAQISAYCEEAEMSDVSQTVVTPSQKKIEYNTSQTDDSLMEGSTGDANSPCPPPGGYKPMTTDFPSNFYCNTCQVYFENRYFLKKHEVIHERNIMLDIDDVDERRQAIERLVRKLTFKEPKVPLQRQRSAKSFPVLYRTKFFCAMCHEYYRNDYFLRVHNKDKHAGGANVIGNAKGAISDTSNQSFSGESPQKNVVNVRNIKKEPEVENEEEHNTSKPELPVVQEDENNTSTPELPVVQEDNPTIVLSGLKPMTADHETKFWCKTCQVYFTSIYYFTKHQVIHEHNIEINAIDILERRTQIEQAVRKLTAKEPSPAVPKKRSYKSLPVNHRTKFQCRTCEQYFRNDYYMKIHIKDAHTVGEENASTSENPGEVKIDGTP